MQGFVDIFDMLLAATSRFRELKLQREEYVCLKAMILLNSSTWVLMCVFVFAHECVFVCYASVCLAFCLYFCLSVLHLYKYFLLPILFIYIMHIKINHKSVGPFIQCNPICLGV